MKSALLRTLAVSTLMLMLVSIVSARDENNRLWEPYNGVGIRSGYHIEWFRSLSWNDQGEMCVTWSDTRAGGRDIYGQVITPENGEVWGEGGLMLGNGLSRQEDPHIMATSDGGWILTWIDYRFDVAIEDIGDVWMQKLNSDGEPQWRYEEEPNSWGIPIARFQGKQIAVQTFDDGDGGGVAVWADARNGSADIYCQRVNSNGEAPQGWIERDADFAIDDTTYGTYQPGNLMVAGGPEAQGTLEGGYTADTDGAGGIIVGWKDARDPNNQNLYAQRISVDGERMWDVDPETPDSARAYRGLPICLWADEQDNLKLCPDGESGAFFIWKDPREDFNNDIYGQRVDAEGNILWTENGAEVVLADAVQTKLRIVNSAPGEAIILWEDQREDFYTSDLRMQKLSGDDGLVLNWGEVGQENDGLILCDADQNQFEARISADGNGGALISWTDERFSEFPDEDLYAQYIDSDGEKYWGDENGLLICDAELQQTGNIGRILNDDVYTLVWQDFRKGSPGLFYQTVDVDAGNVLLEENGIELIFGIDFNAFKAQPLYDGENVYVGFEDNRLGGLGKYAYLQKVDFETGERYFEENGLMLTPGYPYNDEDTVRVRMDSVTFTINNDGDVFSAWHDNRESYYYVVASQKVDSEGNLLWGNRGAIVAPPEGAMGSRDQSRPKLLPADDGGLYVGFVKYTVDFYQNILIQRMSSDGEPQWTENDHNALVVTDELFDHVVEGMTFFDDGSILVVFNRTVSPTNYDILAQRISVDGALMWDEPVEICAIEEDTTIQNRAKLVNVPDDGVLIVWEDQRRGAPIKDVYGQVISADGSVSWEANGAPLIVASNQQENIAVGVRTNDPNSFWLSWQDSRDATDPDIYAQRFDWDGNPLLEPDSGVVVSITDHDQNNPRLVVGTDQDTYIIWEDGTGDFHVNLRYTHLDEEGNPVDAMYETENGLLLCDAYHQQINLTMIGDAHGGFIAAWEDLRSTGKEFLYNIYSQRVIDDFGNSVGDDNSAVARHWELESAYPNPFNPSTKISFTVGQGAAVKLIIYDILGRRVNQLVNKRLIAGKHTVTWDGTSSNGSVVASGPYFYRLEADGVNIARSVIMLK